LSSSVATLAASQPEPAPSGVDHKAPGRWSGWRFDALAGLGYLALALVVTFPLWRGDGVLRENRDDPIFFQWVLLHAARIFTDGDNPFFADQVNAPFGINLMANTSVLGLAIPLVPVTLLFGPYASFLVLITSGLAGTAFAWYLVLSRHLVSRWIAALIGGAFCGFAPGMIAQSNGHPNISNQFLVPFLVLTTMRLRDTGQWRRTGLTLAGLVIYQVFINEEVLFLTALVLGVFTLLWAAQRRAEFRSVAGPALKALGLCAAVAGVTLAIPLYWQFFGRSAYSGLPVGVQEFGTDLLATSGYARESILGSASAAHRLASSAAEENTFFGTPLLLVLLGVLVVLIRSAAARALVATLVVFWGLSLGPHVRVGGELTDVTGPWYLLAELPLFESVVPTRFGLALIPMIGVLLALAVDRFRPAEFRPLWTAVVVAVLLPIAPTPLTVSPPHVTPTPTFFTSGSWRKEVPPGGVVLPLPPGFVTYLTAMSWQLDTNLDFRIVGGYYLAPVPGDPSRRASFGPAYPPAMRLLWYIGERGGDVYVSDEHRQLAREDFAVHRVTTLVLPARHPKADDVRRLVDQLVGPGERVDDVWVWDVRAFVAAG